MPYEAAQMPQISRLLKRFGLHGIVLKKLPGFSTCYHFGMELLYHPDHTLDDDDSPCIYYANKIDQKLVFGRPKLIQPSNQ